MKDKSWLVLAGGLVTGVVLGVVILFGFSGLNARGEAAQAPGLTAPRVGSQALDFTLTDLNGEQVSLNQFKGHPVLVNFWATWCGPCKVEMPLLEDRFERYAPDLIVLGINYDEPENIVQNYVDQLGLKFTILLDPGGKVNDQYLIQGYPSSVFIDKEGIIQAVHIGQLSDQVLDQYLAAIGVKP